MAVLSQWLYSFQILAPSRFQTPNQYHHANFIALDTRSFAIAERPRDVLVSRNLATTNHPIWKTLQLINDLEVYTHKVITIGAFISIGTIYRIVSNIAILASHRIVLKSRYLFLKHDDTPHSSSPVTLSLSTLECSNSSWSMTGVVVPGRHQTFPPDKWRREN